MRRGEWGVLKSEFGIQNSPPPPQGHTKVEKLFFTDSETVTENFTPGSATENCVVCGIIIHDIDYFLRQCIYNFVQTTEKLTIFFICIFNIHCAQKDVCS